MQQTKSSPNTWQLYEIEKLSIALSITYKTQTTYKEALDLKDRVAGWKFVLEEEFNLAQVLFALKEFMKISQNMPVPADIVKILKPAPHLISESEYVQACKWQENNGYPMFSDAKDIKDAYKKQNEHKREKIISQNKKIQELACDVSKQLTNRV